MKRLYTKTKFNLETSILKFKESKHDFPRLHLGTNSISLALVLLICLVISSKVEVLNLNYLKGLNDDLTFFIGLFSIILGVVFYKFWRLGEKSVYTLHFAKTNFMPKDVNLLFVYRNFSFAIGSKIKEESVEFHPIVRQLLCIAISLNFALLIIDNSEFNKLKSPSEIFQSKSEYCPDEEQSIENAAPEQGCELIIRAYKLGYAKSLGICEPKKSDPGKMKICQKRRKDEPYLHYKSRLLLSSIKKQIDFFENNKLKNIEDKFYLQLQKLEEIKDYQSYAISAAPRASHHIWTNLPYPENIFIQKYRELLKPNQCIEQFQNQTNTVELKTDDERKNSKLLEHVYGQLLFNPKSKITVGFCKEYKIHWNSDPNICERLANNPKTVLQEEKILPEVELVLKRHDVANAILSLDEEIQQMENIEDKTIKAKTVASDLAGIKKAKQDSKTSKNKIIKSKIAKAKQQIRKKNEIVSFQCFMQANESDNRNSTRKVTLNGSQFMVRTRYFPLVDGKGESQISMYNEFSKLLENSFHYSQLTSRSDINVEAEIDDVTFDKSLLEQPSYLFSRLELLKNVDIFLGNNWILERDDLLGVYPYHVHLQNYVNKFRMKYKENRGRL